MTLWLVILERRRGPSWRAEVGAETFTEAIEWFKCWLVVHEPAFDEAEVVQPQGDHIGTCEGEGVQQILHREVGNG